MEDGVGGGQHFMAMEDGEDSVAGPSQCRFFWRSQVRKRVLNTADG